MTVIETATIDDGWRNAGEAWEHAATDWAYLFEPYARDAIEDVFDDLATIGAPGVVEGMFGRAGFVAVERGATSAILEFPDADIAWRALRSPGLVKPALDAVGETELQRRLMPTIERFRRPDGSYRLVNELSHAIGHTPPAGPSTRPPTTSNNHQPQKASTR